MNTHYSSLIGNTLPILAEKKPEYQFLTERHIQAVWLEQKYFKGLTTAEGIPIEVLSPGIWNAEAGPDFLKAHLRIGDLDLRGDIEIHLVDESWSHHHHDIDPRYNNVILHLSYWKPKSFVPIITSNKRPIIQTHLENFLTIPLARLLNLIDLDLYPYKKFIGSGRCSQTLFNTLPESKITNLFQNASEWRLTQKRKNLHALASDPNMQVLNGIALALGYKHNAEAFQKLLEYWNPLLPQPEDHLLAIALDVFGFFSAHHQKLWGHSKRYLYYLETAASLRKNDFKIPLVTTQIRPLNHPIRRLAYLAKLLGTNFQENAYGLLEKTWSDSWPEIKKPKNCKMAQERLYALLPIYLDSYWNTHYLFEETPREVFLPLIGNDLKREIVINTYLPIIYDGVIARGDGNEIKAFQLLHHSFTPTRSRKTKYLIHRFFGETPKGKLLNRAYLEQGAYQLHRDFCVHYEASCEGCPFVERFKSMH